MFYKMITAARDRWMQSPGCTVGGMIRYIEARGQMRDAQIDAIKTYLYLKIKCGCKPLSVLFADGAFNCLNLDKAALPVAARDYLKGNPAAAALYEYACLKNDAGEQVSKALEAAIVQAPERIDYRKFFHDAFYGVSYTDYLFSLPMGAGKTWLMAAFIYLDLYFARNEPDNVAFAHNFIIFAPSGLKTSVVPSLKSIQKFDPTWILPEPAASEIKRMISFEVLDENKSAKKSNKTKNPNVQKIANHQPLSELFGLVAVTNAEKVILDRVEEKDGQISLFEESDDDRDRQANELRNLIGKLPMLSVFIDEVHHAVSSADKSQERKLRAVVDRWTERGTVNSVIGFSGTPYLEKAEKIAVTDKLRVAAAEISNIVYYYPLIDGVGNFLKRPVVKISDAADSGRIIEQGIREFLDRYKDTVYANGTTAKLGIYCGTISKLEQLAYPIAARVAAEYGLDPNCVLRFYRESKSKDPDKPKYKAPADSQMEFDILDTDASQKRIVLLAQIGKEGWDCRSLTGIVLSQEGDCPTNMVLQTTCRCLRQVEKEQQETALIYLNGSNGEKLEAQLRQQQHISIREFMDAPGGATVLHRYNRTDYLKLPNIEFYQLKVDYETQTLEAAAPERDVPKAVEGAKADAAIVKTTDFSLANATREVDADEHGAIPADFNAWRNSIVRESLYTLDFPALRTYETQLQAVFKTITYERGSVRYYSSKYDQAAVRENIRKAFTDKRDYTTKEEAIREEASLLNIVNFKEEIFTTVPNEFVPDAETVKKIHLDDQGKLKPDKATLRMMELAEAVGQTDVLELLRKKTTSHPHRDRTFHYLPYHMDKGFEPKFFDDLLSLEIVGRLGLEVYYNGDRAMTEFKIKCYKRVGRKWGYIGLYTPDFLIIQRRNGAIYKAVIVETKGEGFAEKFKDRREFMDTEFKRLNNEMAGYPKFEFLYLEDTLGEQQRINTAYKKLIEFFEERL